MSTTTNTIISTILGYVLDAITITKTVKVSPFKDSPDSKKITLKIMFNKISLQSVIDAAVRSDVIRYQASARKVYNSLIDGSTVERNFSAPIRTVIITPEMAEQAFMAKLANMTPEDRLAEIQKMQDAAQKMIDEEQAKADDRAQAELETDE